MSRLTQLVLATANPGKRREFDRLLAPLGVTVLDQASLGVEPAPEPYGTFLENALAKARHASVITGLPALADDSGLCVSALFGAPGVHSARFADPVVGMAQDQANNQKLVASLSGVADRQAMYVAILVLILSPDDPLPIVAQGTWVGQFIDHPRGAHGFGYDPHFLLPELGLTAAELDAIQKNKISHRAQAMRLLINTLRERAVIDQRPLQPTPVGSFRLLGRTQKSRALGCNPSKQVLHLRRCRHCRFTSTCPGVSASAPIVTLTPMRHQRTCPSRAIFKR